MTLRRCYDSTSAQDLPTDGDLYLAYVDGRYANYDAVKARFPRKPVVKITVTGRDLTAHMADVEAGDLTPASGAAWAKAKLARHEFPVLYFPESSRSAVVKALKANGVDPAHVGMFPAQYDGKAALNQPGDVGKQYASSDVPVGQPGHTGGHKDVSVVRAYWPGVDAAPRGQGLPLRVRVAVRVATRGLGRRSRPLYPHGRQIVTALRAACNHALNVK